MTSAGRKWQRPSKWWLLLIPAVPCLTFAGFAGWLWWDSYDHTEAVGKAIIFGNNDQFDSRAFAGALAGRFPEGSPAQDLRQFVTSIGGACRLNPSEALHCDNPRLATAGCAAHPQGSLSCSMPMQGTLCFVSSLEIQATVTPDNRIAHLASRRISEGC